MGEQFTWIPFYEQVADRLGMWREKQSELIRFLDDLDRQGLPVVSLEDQDAAGRRFQLTEIDPFTFFASFNRKQKLENRQKICAAVKAHFSVEAPVPDDFDGVPIVDNRSSWFFSYSKQREPNAIDTLWRVFVAALGPDPFSDPDFSNAFDAALQLRRVRINLTMGLYWIRPSKFLALDGNNRRHLNIEMDGDLTARTYIDAIAPFSGKSFPELSAAAWRSDDSEAVKPIPPSSHVISEISRAPRVWLWSPGDRAAHWDDLYQSGQMAIGWNDIGDLRPYTSLDAMKQAVLASYPRDGEPINDGLACYEFTHEVRPGDHVIAKRGRRTMIGYGVVKGPYRHDNSRVALKNVRDVQWLQRGTWEAPFLLPMKALTRFEADSSSAEQLIEAMKKGQADQVVAVPPSERRRFVVDDALQGLFMPREELRDIVELWRTKKNLILQGAPGVGKSFVGRRLAYALMGYEDPSRVKVVQFHQAYAYEDFVQGFRPNGQGFSLRDGAFVEFCRRAVADEGETYVFVIDEINRGNLSRILGEMMLLIEADKRDKKWGVRLAYSPDESFHVPANLYILGLMNTADRSLAVVDYALRRRFAFRTVQSGFESETFATHLAAKGVSNELVARIRQRIGQLNNTIAEDRANLGPGFCIGHSYFCDPPMLDDEVTESDWYRRVVEHEVLPLLSEYWFDAPEKVDQWRATLLSE